MDLASGIFFLVVGYKDPIYRSLDIQLPAVVRQFNDKHSCEQFRNHRYNMVINHIRNKSRNDTEYVSYFQQFFYFQCISRVHVRNIEIIENNSEAIEHINTIHRNLLSKYRAYKMFNNQRR